MEIGAKAARKNFGEINNWVPTFSNLLISEM